MWTSHVSIHIGDDSRNDSPDVSSFKLPQGGKRTNTAQADEWIQGRGDPGDQPKRKRKKKQFGQMVGRMSWICSWICRRWKGEKTHVLTSRVDRFSIAFQRFRVLNSPRFGMFCHPKKSTKIHLEVTQANLGRTLQVTKSPKCKNSFLRRNRCFFEFFCFSNLEILVVFLEGFLGGLSSANPTRPRSIRRWSNFVKSWRDALLRKMEFFGRPEFLQDD